jgi:hypothetical protein
VPLTPALAVALAVIAVLLFAWPLAREPRLQLLVAFVHVLVAWAAVVGVLWWISRFPAPPRPRGEDRDG